MSGYDVEKTVERDVDGRIARIGVTWAETRPFVDKVVIKAWVLSVGLLIMGLLWAAFGGFNWMLGLGLIGAVGAFVLLRTMPGNPRALYFRAGGRMETPYGLFYFPNNPTMTGNHAQIVSIEARLHHQDRETEEKLYEVAVLFVTGDLVYLSRNCMEWVAIKAAAQLTHSLNELRREQGNGYDSAWAVAS